MKPNQKATAKPSATFTTTKGKRIGAVAFIIIFLAWTIAAVWVTINNGGPHLRGGFWALLITAGVPTAMFVLSIFALLQLLTVLEVSETGFKLEGPLGTQRLSWNEVVRYDLDGSLETGIKVFTKSGRQVDLNFGFYEGAENLRQMVLPRLPVDDGIDPLVARSAGRKGLIILTICILGFFSAAAATTPSFGQPGAVAIGMLAVLLVPLCLFVATYEARLDQRDLSVSSCFGKKSIHLGQNTIVSVATATSKNGPYETLTIQQTKQKIVLYSRSPRYLIFKARILAICPPTTGRQKL